MNEPNFLLLPYFHCQKGGLEINNLLLYKYMMHLSHFCENLMHLFFSAKVHLFRVFCCVYFFFANGYQLARLGILLTGLTLPHSYPYPKPGPRLSFCLCHVCFRKFQILPGVASMFALFYKYSQYHFS